MQQISARRFRLTFQELSEPVVVSRRGQDGTIHLIGEWRPILGGEALVAATEKQFQQAGALIRAVQSPSFAQFRPAPKPKGKK